VDAACQQTSTLAVTSVDCLTCYDSVGHGPASLACQQLGAPPSLLCTISQSIQLMKFFLWMVHWDFNQFNGADATAPPISRHVPRQWGWPCDLACGEHCSHGDGLISWLHCHHLFSNYPSIDVTSWPSLRGQLRSVGWVTTN